MEEAPPGFSKRPTNVADLLVNLSEQQMRLAETYKGFLESMRLESNLHEAKDKLTGLKQAGSELISLQKEHLTKMLLMMYPIFRVVMPSKKFKEDACIQMLEDRAKLESYDLVELSCILRCYFAKLAIYVYHMATFVGDRGEYERTVSEDPDLIITKDDNPCIIAQEGLSQVDTFPNTTTNQRNHGSYNMKSSPTYDDVNRQIQSHNDIYKSCDYHSDSEDMHMEPKGKYTFNHNDAIPSNQAQFNYVRMHKNGNNYRKRGYRNIASQSNQAYHLKETYSMSRYRRDNGFEKGINERRGHTNAQYIQKQSINSEPITDDDNDGNDHIYHNIPHDGITNANMVAHVNEISPYVHSPIYSKEEVHNQKTYAGFYDSYVGNMQNVIGTHQYSPVYKMGFDYNRKAAYQGSHNTMGESCSKPLMQDYAVRKAADCKTRENIGLINYDNMKNSDFMDARLPNNSHTAGTTIPDITMKNYGRNEGYYPTSLKDELPERLDAFCCTDKRSRSRNERLQSAKFEPERYHPSFYVQRRDICGKLDVKDNEDNHTRMTYVFYNSPINNPKREYHWEASGELDGLDEREDYNNINFTDELHQSGSSSAIVEMSEVKDGMSGQESMNAKDICYQVNGLGSGRPSLPKEKKTHHRSVYTSDMQQGASPKGFSHVAQQGNYYDDCTSTYFVEPPAFATPTNYTNEAEGNEAQAVESINDSLSMKSVSSKGKENRSSSDDIVIRPQQLKPESTMCLHIQLSQQDIFADQMVESSDRDGLSISESIFNVHKREPYRFYNQSIGEDTPSMSIRNQELDEISLKYDKVGNDSDSRREALYTEARESHRSFGYEMNYSIVESSKEDEICQRKETNSINMPLNQRKETSLVNNTVDSVDSKGSSRFNFEVPVDDATPTEEVTLSSNRIVIPPIDMNKLRIRN